MVIVERLWSRGCIVVKVESIQLTISANKLRSASVIVIVLYIRWAIAIVERLYDSDYDHIEHMIL